ncbi:hypothetical protein [Dactylosporangium sp. CA-233914]|uniref:hypothetical protein n=1 Tax=Dactylosporangium sp. CA-233914 TaxID=3239934 RepID=UPI003D911D19
MFPDDDYEEVAAKVTGSLDLFGVWDAGWNRPIHHHGGHDPRSKPAPHQCHHTTPNTNKIILSYVALPQDAPSVLVEDLAPTRLAEKPRSDREKLSYPTGILRIPRFVVARLVS